MMDAHEAMQGQPILGPDRSPSAIEELMNESARYMDFLDRLEAKLTPFLKPAPPGEPKNEVSQIISSPLSTQVMVFRHHNGRLLDLIERVDN